MSQISSLRFLSSNPLFKSSFTSTIFLDKPRSLLKPYSPFTVLACRKPHRSRSGGGGGRGGWIFPQRRSSGGSGTLREKKVEMEKEFGFNKRRAEGRDKSGKPKTLQLKMRKLNPVSTICYVQILGTGMDTQDTSPSVLLFFDKQRFIFNTGEGLQRFCTEHKIKLSKIDHMFLTRVCSETAGGLPGLLLSLAGMGEEGMSVNIWGPSDLNYLVDAMKSFIPNAAMVHTHSFGAMENSDHTTFSNSEAGKHTDPIVLIDDEVVRISAILLRPRNSGKLTDVMNESNVSLLTSLAREHNTDQIHDPLVQCSDNILIKKESPLKPGDIAVLYACELPEIKGKFDPDKAASLGLKPGPKYRELQLGNSVMSDRLNIMVHPSDVLGPSSPGPIILLVDCPSGVHIPDLLSAESLKCYYVDSVDQQRECTKTVNCIIHLGPASVTKRLEYQKWMERFAHAQHIMAGHEMKNVEIPILRSSARISSRLNYLCPQLFPAPSLQSLHINGQSLKLDGSCEASSSSICENISAENLLKFHLRPYAQLGLDRSAIPSSLKTTEVVNELLSEIPEIVDISTHVSQLWHGNLEENHDALPKDHIDMVEEPWIRESACVPSENMGEQMAAASRNDFSCPKGSWENKVEHSSEVPACLNNISREDMEIILLGTGSSQPSKYRNVSSIFINLFSRGSLLLDCGEGTLAQLKRRFGVKGADDAVKSLKFIWISHIHADHHAGIARVLSLRCQLLKDVPHEPLLVIGPRPLKQFLNAYSRLEDLDVQFLDCRHTTEESLESLNLVRNSGKDCSPEYADKDYVGEKNEFPRSQKLKSTLFSQSGKMQSFWKRHGSPVDTTTVLPQLMNLKHVLKEAGLETSYSVPVVHCPHAFGIVLKAAVRINNMGKSIPGWKFVYSGDTRPCQALIDASHDATVLIHEATFEDNLEDEAIAKNHSTTKEAIKVGTSAGAYRVILTHFSQRYPKFPVFDERHMRNTCIAFDLMSVNVADLPVLPKVLPYLKVLFRNEMILDEQDDAVELASQQ
ncbi:tRNase Z TRZ3, mitochondrial-like isoform X1 [Dioscorea cayenensis subsp. rotundata]|uniref:ribonuclease Z n=2 Tax=Dioscorea cayennensis subsp. rotundata TaxID=55577 RepID=A0AB40BF32_DIOCR|nr:tRNase Z TRZ3, mitochondrial-like isoform X1 [Dioscorea cayenensis subsp. rotundata]